MPISPGLLVAGGIGQGLLQGVDAYNTARRTSLDDERVRQQQKFQNTGLMLTANKEGYQIDPDTGSLSETPQGAENRMADLMLKRAHANYFNERAKDKPVKPIDPVKLGTLAKNFRSDMDPDAARAGNFGQISSKVLQSQHLLALARKADGDIRNLTKPEQEEMSIGMAGMLSSGSGGGATDSRVNALVPDTGAGRLANLKTFLFNTPYGQDQQDFTKRMAESIERQAEVSRQQMSDIQRRRLPFHNAWKAADPDSYAAALHEYGLDSEPTPRNPGAGLLSGSATHPQDAVAIDYARSNPKDPRSAAILKANGVQ